MALRAVLGVVALVLCAAGCSSTTDKTNSSDQEGPKCSNGSDEVRILDSGWSATPGETTEYGASYGIVFQADKSSRIKTANIKLKWLDENGAPIDVDRNQPAGGKPSEVTVGATSADSRMQMAAVGWTPLKKEPADVKVELGSVCAVPTSSDNAVVDVRATKWNLRDNKFDLDLDVDIESSYSQKLNTNTAVLLRDGSDKIIGGLSSMNDEVEAVGDLKPGKFEKVISGTWGDKGSYEAVEKSDIDDADVFFGIEGSWED